MLKKPLLNSAAIIKNYVMPENLRKSLSPEMIAYIEKTAEKEIGTENMGVGEWFVIERYLPGKYHKFATDGSRSELSVFRMAGGCNHLFTLLKNQVQRKVRTMIRSLMKSS